MRAFLAGLVCISFVTAMPAAAQKSIRPGPPLDWKTLALALPDSVAGFTADEARGGMRRIADPDDPERESHISSVRRNYIRETSEGEQSLVGVTVADAGRGVIALEPFLPILDFMQDESAEESIEIKGRRATQIIEYGDADIAMGIIYVRLGDRMVVIVQGEGVRDVAELQTVAGLVDYDALESATGPGRN